MGEGQIGGEKGREERKSAERKGEGLRGREKGR